MAKRIMVVEDDPMNAKFFELTLKRRGNFEVIVTEDADQVLQLTSLSTIATTTESGWTGFYYRD